jgi:hypothetical protein
MKKSLEEQKLEKTQELDRIQGMDHFTTSPFKIVEIIERK